MDGVVLMNCVRQDVESLAKQIKPLDGLPQELTADLHQVVSPQQPDESGHGVVGVRGDPEHCGREAVNSDGQTGGTDLIAANQGLPGGDPESLEFHQVRLAQSDLQETVDILGDGEPDSPYWRGPHPLLRA